jgi:hypothetical protein
LHINFNETGRPASEYRFDERLDIAVERLHALIVP